MLHKVHASYFAAPNLCQVLRRYGHSTGSGPPCCDPEKDLLARHPPCQPLTGVCLVRFEKSGKGRRLWHQESGQLNLLAGWFLLPRERVAGGMIPSYSMDRTKALLRGHAAPVPLDHATSTRWAVSTQASPWCRVASRIRPGPLRVSCARSAIATILAPAPASVHLHLARGLRFSVSIKGLLH